MAGTAARSRTTPANASLRIGFPLLLSCPCPCRRYQLSRFCSRGCRGLPRALFRGFLGSLLPCACPREYTLQAGIPLVTRKEPHSYSVFPVLRSVFWVPGSPFPVLGSSVPGPTR